MKNPTEGSKFEEFVINYVAEYLEHEMGIFDLYFDYMNGHESINVRFGSNYINLLVVEFWVYTDTMLDFGKEYKHNKYLINKLEHFVEEINEYILKVKNIFEDKAEKALTQLKTLPSRWGNGERASELEIEYVMDYEYYETRFFVKYKNEIVIRCDSYLLISLLEM